MYPLGSPAATGERVAAVRSLRCQACAHGGGVPGSSGIGLAALLMQKLPVALMSSVLLYMRWTFQVFGPTVIVVVSPLQMSPFSSLTGPNQPRLKIGSVAISENS